MSLPKAILVPVDFSAVAANAFDYALRFADRYPARIDLLYCLPTALSSPGMDRIMVGTGGDLRAEATKRMLAFRRQGIDRAINDLRGIPEVCTLIEAGDLNEVAKKRIEDGQADLVIMGTTGRQKPLAGLVGTNTTYLMDDATVPVIIVPDEAAYRAPKRMIYATDLQHLDPFRIDQVFALLDPFEPEANFVHVATPSNETTEYNLSLLRKAIDKPEMNNRLDFTRLSGANEVDVMLEYAQSSGADLLVMNRPHRGWLQRLWKQSRTREAILKTEVPLMILHEQEGLRA